LLEHQALIFLLLARFFRSSFASARDGCLSQSGLSVCCCRPAS